MTKVTLRTKAISGARQSLYLDFYPAIINSKTGALTRREFLGLYLLDKPKTVTDKKHNKKTQILAEQIRQKRDNQLNKPESYTSKTCSDNWAVKIENTIKETAAIKINPIEKAAIKIKPIEDLKAKEFLTVKDVSKLLNCSVRTAYYLIERGNIKAVNIAQRKTLIRRSEIDKLFN